MNASIVIDTGFGDAGKGRTVDWLCAKLHNKEKSVVVRFSGGQQAGHTVINSKGKHIHSSFPAGTLRSVPGYISHHCTIYPTSMKNEWNALKSKGLFPVLTIHPLAMVTTPYDVVANRANELKNRHGSCGMGVGKTMERNRTPYKLHIVDLFLPEELLLAKLASICRYYKQEFKKDEMLNEFLLACTWIRSEFDVKDYSFFTPSDITNIIFEGSQGIMLDMDHGVFPHVTYANTTSKNAFEIINIISKAYSKIFIDIHYVTRCYQTRHGIGPMTDESPLVLKNNEEEINVNNPWQGEFRVGKLDMKLIQTAIRIDSCYILNHFTVRKNLVLTCVDQMDVYEHTETGRKFGLTEFKSELMYYTGIISIKTFSSPNTTTFDIKEVKKVASIV